MYSVGRLCWDKLHVPARQLFLELDRVRLEWLHPDAWRIFSTSTDLYKWTRAMNDSSFLSRAALNRMKTNHLGEISGRFSYGYGWVVHVGSRNTQWGICRLTGNI